MESRKEISMDETIFKAYDIRGEYPKTINEDVASKIGQAFVQHFNLKKVAVGHDGRISSPQLEEAIISGIMSAGANATRLGLISTDMIYFAAGAYDYDGVLIVTASHNPKDNNGFKMVLKGAVVVSGEEGLEAMRDMIKSNKLQDTSNEGKEDERNIYADYVQKLHSLINIDKLKPLKVVVDAGNGVGGFIFEKVIKGLPIEMIPLYCEVDGNFPHHQPSPIEDKNLVDIKKKVAAEEDANLGLAFDGDGDRVYLIDEKGGAINASVMTAMIAKRMLQRHPGSRILYNVNVGWIVPETIKANGGVGAITKVGHSLIKAQMREEDGLFAGEHSGHYFFKDLYYADSGMLAALTILEMMSELNQPLSAIAKEYDKYFLSGEINTEVADPTTKIAEVKLKYQDGKILELDGLSVEYQDWRFILRPSNTESLLRLNVEAKNKEMMTQKRDELLSLIRTA